MFGKEVKVFVLARKLITQLSARWSTAQLRAVIDSPNEVGIDGASGLNALRIVARSALLRDCYERLL